MRFLNAVPGFAVSAGITATGPEGAHGQLSQASGPYQRSPPPIDDHKNHPTNFRDTASRHNAPGG
jgi:hypothetical protein